MINNISVIIPVYNASQYVAKAVESAVGLSEVDEVLLIEDGSRDDSLLRCQELESKYDKVKLFTHPSGKNEGAGKSRNLGIQKAKNNLIAFLDADDYYLPNRFLIDQQILTDTDIEGVYNCTKAIFDSENLKKKFLTRYESIYTTTSEKIEPGELLYKLLFGGSGRFHTNAITLRKTVFEKVGLFDAELKLAQDTEMWVKLAACCILVGGDIKTPVAIRRVHTDNRIHADDETINYYKELLYSKLFFWAINQQHLSFAKKNYFFILYLQYVKKQKTALNLIYHLFIQHPRLLLNIFFYRKIYQIITK